MKVCTVVGTRPEIIKLSQVMKALDAAEGIEHILIHTGQNYDYELNEIFFKEMGIRKPNYYLNAAEHRTLRANTPIETIAEIMVKLEDKFAEVKPDAVLILGDTNSCVAAAYAAKRLKIPIFHMEAGNRCFDERVPEEVNRRVVDTLSDINMPYSDLARYNLMREGFYAAQVIKTGSPQNEILYAYNDQIESSQVLSQLNLTPNGYFLVSVHREENCTEEKFAEFVHMLDKLAYKYKQRIIVSAHPRLRKMLDKQISGLYDIQGFQTVRTELDPLVELHKPFGFFDYNKLQRNARVVLSDSGTITEESVLQEFPALNLRETHERPEGMEEAAVMMTGFKNAVNCIPVVEAHEQALTPDDYCHLNVSEKVVRIILSYIDYVNRNVWRK
jgi:UDP-N-acetylglucosamine 2-epimerase